MPRPIIIDTDPGIDDAVAILLALASPELDVRGIVAVAGNIPLTLTGRNARAVCELAGRPELPVYDGCARPMGRPLVIPERAHGSGGLGRLVLPPPSVAAAAQHGVDFLIETMRCEPARSVTVCALGPLTNLGMALVKAPDLAERIAQIVLMGGASRALGNITPAAEFNIYVDPHAAELVFASGIPVAMMPLDLTFQVLSTPARVASFRALGNRCGLAVADLIAPTGKYPGFAEAQPLHDPCVVAYLLAPELFSGGEVNVAVETQSPLTIGMTVIDWRGVSGRPANARVLQTVDADALYRLLVERIARLP